MGRENREEQVMDILDWIAAGIFFVALMGFGYLFCEWALSEFGGDA